MRYYPCTIKYRTKNYRFAGDGFSGTENNQQKSGASIYSARAAEPAAIVATLDGGDGSVSAPTSFLLSHKSTEKWRWR